MHKIFIFITLCITQTISASDKSSHYQLHYHQLFLKKPANKFVEPIISCTIRPSRIQIKHGELYQIDTGKQHLYAVTTTISLTGQNYNSLKQLLEQKKIVYLEAHNEYRSLWQIFEIKPNQVKIS